MEDKNKSRYFIITIDTEGDDIWSKPDKVTTRNAVFLPRFQELCEKFNFKPTYLTNYEMATDPVFVDFARDVIKRDCGEIGMHLHAWNTPPYHPIDDGPFEYGLPYLIEYPPEVMDAKISTITRTLEEAFSISVRSHRAGRWAFNHEYARMLEKHGYCYDCSVTPHVDWRRHLGSSAETGGSDYRAAPSIQYRLSSRDVNKPGDTNLIEIPMTVRGVYRKVPQKLYEIPLVSRAVNRIFPRLVWMRPNRRNIAHLLKLVDVAAKEGVPYLQFMLHSSELMPAGSPTFKTDADIENLYRDMERLFERISQDFLGSTVSEYGDTIIGNL